MRRIALSTVTAITLALILAGALVAGALGRGSEDADSFASQSPGDSIRAVADGTPAPAPSPLPSLTSRAPTTAAPSAAPGAAPALGDVADGDIRRETFVSPDSRIETFTVLDVGTVTVAIGDTLQVLDAQPARSGWRVETHSTDRQAEASFRSGRQRVDWKAEFEDGQVRIRVRDRRGEDDRDRGRGRGRDDQRSEDRGGG